MRLLSISLVLGLLAGQASAFCGFYVAQSDGALYNEASKVVLVRDGRQTTITMSSDYTGPASDFALVVPTPVVLREDQIREVDPAVIAHLDAYTAPRLVEYFDDDPCQPQVLPEPMIVAEAPSGAGQPTARSLGVRVEAQYAIGSYDIAILSANQSDGLVTYLRQEGYNIPDGAELTLADYIAMGMKFFVAKVNLERHAAAEKQELQPLQMSFRSRNFMLPLQLGKINSTGTQDLIVMTLTREGRVEAENYRNARVPSDINVPLFVKDMFPNFYRLMFAKAAGRDTVMTEYAWDMAWCDPCAADPMTAQELVTLGATWVRGNQPPEAFVTRMHVQYDETEFQKDLLFRVTTDRENFQGRYIMTHPFEGEITCEAGRDYVTQKRRDIAAEAAEVHDLTGWRTSDIAAQINKTVPRAFRP